MYIVNGVAAVAAATCSEILVKIVRNLVVILRQSSQKGPRKEEEEDVSDTLDLHSRQLLLLLLPPS